MILNSDLLHKFGIQVCFFLILNDGLSPLDPVGFGILDLDL